MNFAKLNQTKNNNKNVIVGMSGGVDSSVAAYLLLKQGYQVRGLFMKNWDEDDNSEYCTAVTDLNDAKNVCKTLGIELIEANFATEYWDKVFAHFLKEYQAGRTPNPDILCNKEIKFKAFLNYAIHLGADFIATGHYARLVHLNEQTQLLKALDSNKDQSYFLHCVNEKQFRQSLFPLGDLQKVEVRKIAKKLQLKNYNKKDSTGICFIGERKFKDFLERYIPAQPGKIISLDGKILGKHQGLMYYTIGQRQGLGIGGHNQFTELPWYVVDKDLKNNTLIVAQGVNHPALFKQELIAKQFHWINTKEDIISNKTYTAKIRYRQCDQTCQLILVGDDKYHVKFNAPQRAIAPGQYIVIYDHERCLGGGVIQ